MIETIQITFEKAGEADGEFCFLCLAEIKGFKYLMRLKVGRDIKYYTPPFCEICADTKTSPKTDTKK